MTKGSHCSVVALMADHTLDLLVGVFGILKSGNGFVPIDPENPDERIKFIINNCKIEIIVTERKYLNRILSLSRYAPTLKQLVCLDGVENGVVDIDGVAVYSSADFDGKDAVGIDVRADPDQIAYVVYTSGTTGRPKGVPITFNNLTPLMRWSSDYFKFSDRNRVLQNLSYTFDFGIFEILTTLLFGGALHILDKREIHAPSQYAEYINECSINTIHSTPIFFREVILAGGRMEALKTVHLGGEQLTSDTVDRIFDSVSDDCIVYNGYGPTEATVNSCIFEIGTRSTRKDKGVTAIPIGKPSANNFVYVVDADLKPVPGGVAGELCIGGLGLTTGYLESPNLTAEKFIPNPFGGAPGSFLYRTGDWVRYLVDGNIEFLRRIDHQVKIRGFRIEPQEIEAVMKRHPAIRQALTTVYEAAPGDRRLVGYFVLGTEKELSGSEMRRFLRDRLPDYMVPFTFVRLDSIPLTSNGKIDYRALPPPDLTITTANQFLAPPRTPIEELLAGIWAKVLGLNKLGIHDNFFELGGHSLLAMQVISRVREIMRVELPLRLIFESPTVADLSSEIESRLTSTPAPEAHKISLQTPGVAVRASPAQRGLWTLQQKNPGAGGYNNMIAVRIKGELREEAFGRSIDEVVRRHESLRTSFEELDGELLQLIAETAEVGLQKEDLSGWSGERQRERILEIADQQTFTTFDLRRLPLLICKLIKIGEIERVFFLTAHSIISDEWSIEILLHEIRTLYEAYSRGEESPLPDPKYQYADFVRWQEGLFKEDGLIERLRYWGSQLSGVEPLILPYDYTRASTGGHRGRRIQFYISDELATSLQNLSRVEGTTLFMTLFAAFNILLNRYTGQDDIIISANLARRNWSFQKGIIGLLDGNLALRTDLSGNPTFSELLSRVRATILNAYADKDLPFEKIVEKLRDRLDIIPPPLVHFAVMSQNGQYEMSASEEVNFVPITFDVGAAKFDLSFILDEVSSGLSGSFLYNYDLFGAATISRMIDHFQMLLTEIVADPHKQIFSYSLTPLSDLISDFIEDLAV